MLAGLVNPPFHGRQRDLERVGDLVVGEADDIAQQQRCAQVDVQLLDRSPELTDRLTLLRGDIRDRRGHLRDELGRPRTALAGTHGVQDHVLRDLEEPGRELGAMPEARQRLPDAQEHFLGQILRQLAVGDRAQDVVEDRQAIGVDDRAVRPLVALLGTLDDVRSDLGEHTISVCAAPIAQADPGASFCAVCHKRMFTLEYDARSFTMVNVVFRRCVTVSSER